MYFENSNSLDFLWGWQGLSLVDFKDKLLPIDLIWQNCWNFRIQVREWLLWTGNFSDNNVMIQCSYCGVGHPKPAKCWGLKDFAPILTWPQVWSDLNRRTGHLLSLPLSTFYLIVLKTPTTLKGLADCSSQLHVPYNTIHSLEFKIDSPASMHRIAVIKWWTTSQIMNLICYYFPRFSYVVEDSLSQVSKVSGARWAAAVQFLYLKSNTHWT